DLKYEIGFLAIKNSCSRREIASFRGAESHSDTLRGKQSYAVGFTLTRLEHLDSYRDSATPNFSSFLVVHHISYEGSQIPDFLKKSGIAHTRDLSKLMWLSTSSSPH
ncbi:MAG: hypothetical protein QNJ47_20395, partial [Nostocaceae cyanobacterium]|nr:hypothetical protein [Nostocaceae cyanobacterium]